MRKYGFYVQEIDKKNIYESQRNEQMRYCSCHENIKIHIFELPCNVLTIIHIYNLKCYVQMWSLINYIHVYITLQPLNRTSNYIYRNKIQIKNTMSMA